MTEFLHQSFAEIRKHTPDLNRITDDAAKVVAAVETMLAETGVGMNTEVSAGQIGEFEIRLAYGRINGGNGKFRLVVSAWGDAYDEENNKEVYDKFWEKPWSDCPRAEKLCSFKAVPELLKKIAEEEKRAIQEMTGTADTIAAVMAAIKK